MGKGGSRWDEAVGKEEKIFVLPAGRGTPLNLLTTSNLFRLTSEQKTLKPAS